MKKFVIIIIITLYFVFLFGNDFRKADWGMSIEEVKKTEETEILKETNDVLVYETTLAGYQALVAYIFAGNKLTRAKYSFIEDHSNKNDYISDYSNLKTLLTKKYGNPYEDETFWKNDLYRDDYSDWGFAISLGHLFYYAKWDSESTDIVAILQGENYQIETIIEYTSKDLENQEEKIREAEALNNFSENGFRSIEWGKNPQVVKESEKLELLSEDDGLLMYETDISGLKLIVGYLFTSDKLTTGRYLSNDNHSNKNDYITDYKLLKNLLEKKYGSPLEDEIVWKNDLYRDDYSEWGFAISLGHLYYYSKWSNNSSDITIILSGENYEITLLIEFKSKNLKDFEKEEKEKVDLDNL